MTVAGGGKTGCLALMKKLILVRHGATEANLGGQMRGWSDDDLSELGRWQAARTAECLKSNGPPVDVIYTSTLPRSIETGHYIAQALAVPVEAHEDLRELNLGSMEGAGERDMWSYFMKNATIPGSILEIGKIKDVTFPGGEAVSEFMRRIDSVHRSIADRHNDGSVLVVCHGVAAMVSLGKMTETHFVTWPKFRLDNCSITVIDFSPKPKVIRFNDTRHLMVKQTR